MGTYAENNDNIFRLSSQCDLCGELDQKVMQLDTVLDICLPCLEKAVSAFRAFSGDGQPSLSLDASEA